RLAAFQCVAGRRVLPHRGCRPRLYRTRHPGPADLRHRQVCRKIMSRERIYLFDTTLRDGQQTPGVDFSVEDKIVIAGMLDEFGFDYVEGGYPGANPTDT